MKRNDIPNNSEVLCFFSRIFIVFFLGGGAEAKAKDMQLNINMAMLINADFTANLGDPVTSVTT